MYTAKAMTLAMPFNKATRKFKRMKRLIMIIGNFLKNKLLVDNINVLINS